MVAQQRFTARLRVQRVFIQLNTVKRSLPLLVRRYSDAAAAPVAPSKIERIVQDIATLNLLETSALIQALKVFLIYFKLEL